MTMNWRKRPLVGHQVIFNLVKATRNKGGLFVEAEIDGNIYSAGTKLTDEQTDAINIVRNDFHGDEWNFPSSGSIARGYRTQ